MAITYQLVNEKPKNHKVEMALAYSL